MDVFAVIDPGLEALLMYPCVLDASDLAQKVSKPAEGVFILGWAENTSAVVRKYMVLSDDFEEFKKSLQSRTSSVGPGTEALLSFL